MYQFAKSSSNNYKYIQNSMGTASSKVPQPQVMPLRTSSKSNQTAYRGKSRSKGIEILKKVQKNIRSSNNLTNDEQTNSYSPRSSQCRELQTQKSAQKEKSTLESDVFSNEAVAEDSDEDFYDLQDPMQREINLQDEIKATKKLVSEFQQILGIQEKEVKMFQKVRSQFHMLINENAQRDLGLEPFNHVKKEKRIKILRAYFFLCNQIFDSQYTQKEIHLVDSILKADLQTLTKMIQTTPQLLEFRMKFTNYSLLYIACMSGHLEIVRYFLRNNYCLDFTGMGSTPLHVAAWCGHYQVVKMLVDHGVPHKILNMHGNLPVQETSNPQIIQLLNDTAEYKYKRVRDEELNSQCRQLVLSFKPGSQNIKQKLQQNKDILTYKFKYQNLSILQIAIMTQNFDAVEYILQSGCYLDLQHSNTNPMHCAALSQNPKIIKLLLDNGIPINIKDQYGYFPIDFIQNQEIRTIFQKAKKDKVNNLISQLIEKDLLQSVINIHHTNEKGKIFMRKLILKNYFKQFENHVDAFHGTFFENLLSIAQHGLKPPGTKIDQKLVQPRQGHISQSQTVNGIKNWARGSVYATPSIYYAGQIYASALDNSSTQDIITGTTIRMASVVQVKVRQGSYERYHQTTLNSYKPSDDEPELLEFRIEAKNGQENNSFVVAIILANEDDYSARRLPYEEMTDLVLNSKEERLLKRLFDGAE